MLDTALVVMARYPEAGTTKTRLARTIGDEAAVHLYRAFLTDLAMRFAGESCGAALHWNYTPPEVDFRAFVATLSPTQTPNMHCFPQRGADFGARMHAAFQWTRAHGFKHTILIGSDSPHIRLEAVSQARAALDEADVVLGPAEDGGYYLIAMREPHDLFSGIPMSTRSVLEMTIAAARRQGLTTRLLEPLFDIDELPDLLRLARLLEVQRDLAPVTADHLNIHEYT